MPYTPGPWCVDGKRIKGLATGLIATVGGDFYDDGRKDSRGWTFDLVLDTAANARLIACAPDLLAALIRMRDEFGGSSCVAKSQGDAWDYANEVIAKAGGE